MNSKLCTLRDDLWLHQHLVSVGLCAALRQLLLQDRDDCGAEFYLYMRRKHRAMLEQYLRGELPETWLIRCAEHFAQNYARHLHCVQNHECDWPMLTEETVEDIGDIPSSQPSPDILLCRRELKQRFSLLISKLTARQVRYLLLHCVERQSYVQIAADHEDDQDAVRMTVNRALKRLYSLCIEAGFDQAEAADYLHEVSPPPRRMRCRLDAAKNTEIAEINILSYVRFCLWQGSI